MFNCLNSSFLCSLPPYIIHTLLDNVGSTQGFVFVQQCEELGPHKGPHG